MTVIVYGKSTFAGNAKTRRHERRRKLAIERDTICNIIDSIFGCDAPDASHEV
ncbi:regulator, partial [Salmonella enterica]|nr:regulator [Salmonella enterica subsp. enterica serovar Virchow]ECB8369102.1 regulator [Salmonella enterica subsp. enterica serovar Anatum]ELJ7612848.1 regulator [Salmonella enterica]